MCRCNLRKRISVLGAASRRWCRVRDQACIRYGFGGYQQLPIEGSPEFDHFLPIAPLILVQLDPGVAVVAGHLGFVFELRADNPLVVVGGGVQEMSQFFLWRPLDGRWFEFHLGRVEARLTEAGLRRSGHAVVVRLCILDSEESLKPVRQFPVLGSQSPALPTAVGCNFSICTLAMRWPSISSTVKRWPS